MLESEIRVIHPSFGSIVLTSRDWSNGGLYLYKKNVDIPIPPLETIIEVQALVFGQDAPILKTKVVRVDPDGFGVMFCELEDSDQSTTTD